MSQSGNFSLRLSIGKTGGQASSKRPGILNLDRVSSKRNKNNIDQNSILDLVHFEDELVGLKSSPGPIIPRISTGSSYSCSTTSFNKRARDCLPDAPSPKRPKEPFKKSPPCHGLCPKEGWTISSDCEHCHG